MVEPYLIVLAGGSGTRLWPLSRRNFPKQFLKIGSDRSLVRETVFRLRPWVSWERVLIVCGNDHADLMKKEFPELGPDQFLLEPCGRNTAAAIAWAAFTLRQRDPQALMVVLPADHKIPDTSLFRKTMEQAVCFAEASGGLITLGIQPTYPATGYGYILRGEGRDPIFRVRSFQEKPDLSTAQKFLESGNYFWNSGMFVWRAEDYFKAYQEFLPGDAELFLKLLEGSSSQELNKILQSFYPHLTSISVDYAVLEKSSHVYVIPARFEWDDVGSLASLIRYYKKDSQKNAFSGNTATLDASGNLILSDQGVVACLGIHHQVIIRNKDSVLVLPLERSEEIKLLLEEIKKEGWGGYL